MLVHIWRIRHFVWPYRTRLTLGVIGFGAARFFEALIPLCTAIAINRLWDDNYNLLWPVAGILAAVIGRYVVVTFARYSVRSAGLFVAFDLRQQLFVTLQKQGQNFFSKNTVGDMMTRAVADIALIQRLVSLGTILCVIFIFALVFGFGFMVYLSPSLTILLLPPLPIVFWYTLRAAKQMESASQSVQDRLSDLGTHVQENLSGIRTIQAMAQEEREIARFASTNQLYANAFYDQGYVNSAMMAWMPTLAAICSLTILGFGGHQSLTGSMPVGNFIAFFMYVNMVVKPFSVAGFIINLFQRASVASNRLLEILDQHPEIADKPSGRTPNHILGKINIQNLTFQYPESSVKVIDNLSLDIKEGETIAIMGRVGSGKTTLLNQIVRLVDPRPGAIKIDDHDVAKYPLTQLRRQVAFVPQAPFLFGEPLGDNVTYDNPHRTMATIWGAVTAADLKETIEDFPDQLQTLIGERGVTLSGGQRQRATLARGLIRDTPILILDDCFSAVDTRTEDHILSELTRLRASKTTLLVSHRVSTARHADRIVVLENGRILESGTHESLLRSNSYYAELERAQREGTEGINFAEPRSNK